jgi:hypothetical protein
MEAFSEIFTYMAGAPAVAGLTLTALTIFLTSDWRLSLTALLVQYLLIGMALTSEIRVEVAIVKILVGVLAVAILYLTARRILEAREPEGSDRSRPRFLGMQVGWGAGPLGLPLRLLTVLLAALAVIRVFNSFSLPFIPADTAFVIIWMTAMGVIGLILSGEPLRVAPALLTILGAFDLVFSSLEPSLAIVGFWSALILLTALAFSYLAAVQGLGTGPEQTDSEAPIISVERPVSPTEAPPESGVPADAEAEP